MGYEFIRVERKGHLTIVTIDRPEVMNALHPPAQLELEGAFNDFAADDESWVAIITGAGDRAFSAGNDLKYQAEHGAQKVREGMKDVRHGFAGLTTRFDCWKPIIAAVNGFALGGGFEIVLACDIVLAAEGAKFGLPEPRVGLMANAGGVHRLPRQIPFHQAMGMLLTGRHVTAEEAHGLGVVSAVVPREKLMETAEAWAAKILECSPMSIRATKEAAYRGLNLSIEEAMRVAFPATVAMHRSADYVEGPKAFAEKRKPNWEGR